MPTGNTQQQINYGATANDGQGDPLRTAFIKTDDNFDNVWLAGPAGSNVRITNNTIGIIDTNGNLILSPNGVGVIQTNNNVVPRANRTYDLGSANLQYRTVYANSAALQTLSVSGNLTVSGNIINTGNIVTDTLTIQLANTTTTANAANGAGITVGASDNIATLLYNSTSNVWTTNIGVSATGNVTAPYFIGNGSQLTGITSSYGNSNVTTLLGNLGSNAISGTGNITTTANISGGNILGNGRQLTGIVSSYGNANVVTLLSGFGNNTITTTGNVTAGNVLTSAEVIASGIIQSGTGLSTGGYLSVDGGADLHNTTVTGNVSATGNISGAYVKGNGSELTNLPAPAVTQDITSNGAMSIMTYDGVIKYVNYATVEPSSGNIAGGNISATGNVTGNYVLGNGSQLTGISTANTGDITFVNTTISAPNDEDINIQALDSDGAVSSAIFMRPGDTYTRLEQWSSQDSQSFTTADWATGVYTSQGSPPSVGAIEFTGANNIIDFVNSLQGTGQIFLSVNGGPLLASQGYSGGVSNITFYVADMPATDPTTVTTFEYYYSYRSQIEIDYDAEEFNFEANNVDLILSTTNQTDIDLISSRDISITGTGSYTLTNFSNVAGIDIRTNATSAGPIWSFGADGNLTAPGNVSAVGNVTAGNIVTAGNVSGNTAGFAIGYRDIPQVSFTANATIATTDAGKHYYSTQSTNYILTIANNASQGFQVGAAITVVNQGTGTITIAQGSGVTLYIAGNVTSGNRSVTTFGMATIMKVATNTWFINGTGVS